MVSDTPHEHDRIGLGALETVVVNDTECITAMTAVADKMALFAMGIA